jgi:hypothetical protein
VRRPTGIPLAGDGALRTTIRRTAVVRTVLAAALVALLVTEVALARSVQARQDVFVPAGRDTVVVIDLSASIPYGAFPTIGRVLRQLARDNVPIGLVVFSDTPYELLPPGTPSRELEPFLRFFTPKPGTHPRTVWDAKFIDNPWQQDFRGGTQISAALSLADSILRRDRVRRGAILLLSDLEAPAEDVPPLTSVVNRLHDEHVPLRVVGLFPSHDSLQFFEQLAGSQAFVNDSKAVTLDFRDESTLSAIATPTGMIAAGLGLLLALAWNEGWLVRLRVPGRLRPREVES